MDIKTFDGVEKMKSWAEENPDKVSRRMVQGWREIIENEKAVEVVFRCKPKQFAEPVDVIVESGFEEEGLSTLLEEAVDREDYELAQKIHSLQEKVKLDS